MILEIEPLRPKAHKETQRICASFFGHQPKELWGTSLCHSLVRLGNPIQLFPPFVIELQRHKEHEATQRKLRATSSLRAFVVPIFLFLFTSSLFAQAPADTSKGKRLEIIVADRYNFQKIEGVGDFVSLAGNVQIRQEQTLFYCDSAVLNQALNTIESFGNIHINDHDSVHTYSQYLKYLGKEKVAYLKNKVKLTDSKMVLTTDELEYNTATHIGTYLKGGKVVNGSTILTSTEGYYYGDSRDIYFKKKVVLTDPEYKVTTDTLLYNSYTQLARFTVPTKIVNGKRIVNTSEGYYDLKNKKAVFGKRPTVDDKDYTLTADDMAFDDATGFGEARGSVRYKSKDTANPFILLANNVKSNNKTNAILATEKPLLIIKQQADSIFITADTLYSAKLTDLEKTRVVPDITDTISNDGRSTTDNKLTPTDDRQPKTDSTLTATNSTFSFKEMDNITTTIDTINLTKPTLEMIERVDLLNKQQPQTTQLSNKNLKPQTPNKKRETNIEKRESKNGTQKPIKPARPDSNSNRFFEGYYHVKIFTDSMQAVGDSMFYSFHDSTFRLFKDPIVWAQENQIFGDTIYLYTENQKPKHFHAFENALAINKVDKDLYNQVKGNSIKGFFKNGNIDSVRTKGSAENIYYTQDESGGFIGVNRSTCDVIDMTFRDRKLYKVVFRNNLTGTLSPIKQMNTKELKVRGFNWAETRRPKSKEDLLNN